MVSAGPYWTSVALAGLGCAAICVAARRHPGQWRVWVARAIGVVLVADALTYSVGLVIAGSWSTSTSLPLPLCDIGVVVAAMACWWRAPLLVELTYFWGIAGTLQGVLTPDVSTGFPHLVFGEYVVGHLAIVTAALFLVVGMQIVPRPGAVIRVFAVTAGYTALVGAIDWLTGADYMFLRSPPSEWTLLRLLGPWPWYILSAAAVALPLLVWLDMPFWPGRHQHRATSPPRGPSARSHHPAATG
jgi:hypothetical integral membrane protein (TIGR02206 family)